MILTHHNQTRKTDWKPHSPFEGHLITLTSTSNFGLEVNILSKPKGTVKKRERLQMHQLSQKKKKKKSYHGASEFCNRSWTQLHKIATRTTFMVKNQTRYLSLGASIWSFFNKFYLQKHSWDGDACLHANSNASTPSAHQSTPRFECRSGTVHHVRHGADH